MKIYDHMFILDKNNKQRRKKIEIQNPNDIQKWFYFIKQKNIIELQKMIDNGFDINKYDVTGQTIAHILLYQKSHSLLKFAIKNNASFSISCLDNFIPLHIICLKSYSYYFFKSIITAHFKNNDISLSNNTHLERILTFMASENKNLSKIKYLFKHFKEAIVLKEKMIEQSIKGNAQENWKYLTGNGVLIQRLNKTLSEKNICKIIKI